MATIWKRSRSALTRALRSAPFHLLVEEGHLQVLVDRLLVDQVVGLEDEADVPRCTSVRSFSPMPLTSRPRKL